MRVNYPVATSIGLAMFMKRRWWLADCILFLFFWLSVFIG